jgi:hypothetical protein
MHPPKDLRELLVKAANGSIREQELARLIQICRVVSETYVLHYRSSLLALLSFHGMTQSDLAYDCIAEMFARDEAGQFYRLQRLLSKLSEPSDTIDDLSLFLAFRTLVTKVANAQLSRTYAQCDPTGAKIMRNIRDHLKCSRALMLVEDFRGKVLRPRECDPLDHLQAFPLELLEMELSENGLLLQPTPHILKEVDRLLREQDQFRRSIPLFDLVRLIRETYGHKAPTSRDAEYQIDLEGLDEDELRSLHQRVVQSLNEKILVTYYLKKKLNDVEARQLSAIMTKIVSDWFAGDAITDSYYQHAQSVLLLSKEEYESHWRQRIEYLAKVAKEIIANDLENGL